MKFPVPTRPLPLRAFLLLISCACAIAAAPTVARAAEKWIRLSSEHFDMLSCTSERDSRQMLVELEQFREFFFRAIPQGRVHDPRPLIFVFDTEKEYTRYQPRTPDGKVRPGIGFHFGGPLQPRIMMQNRHIAQALSTIFHEYVHSLVRARMTKIPAWFNEGLAETFETFDVAGDTVTFGKAHEGHVLTMKRTPLIPLGTLFAVDHKSPYYNERDKMNIFYSQSWLLLHYAMLGKNSEPYTMKNFHRFVDETSSRDTATAEAFAKVFGSDYKNLEKALNAYMRAGTYTTLTIKIPAKPIARKITVRPATDVERDIELAGLGWRSVNAPDAGITLLQLMEKHPENPRVYEILAEMKMRERDNRMAADYISKAVEKNSTEPMAYIWMLRNYYTGANLPLGYVMPEKMAAEYTALVDRAIELAPDSMEAYEMLAIIESQNPAMRIAKLNSVLEALKFMREPTKTYLALATAYYRLKRYKDAEAAIAVMKQDPKLSYTMQRRAYELQREIAKATGGKAPAAPPRPPKETKKLQINPAPLAPN